MARRVSENPLLPQAVPATTGGLLSFAGVLVKQLSATFQQYGYRLNRVLPLDGSEAMTGDLDLGGFALANVGGFSGMERALVKRTTDQTIPDSTSAVVDWEASVYDVGDIWQSGNASRLTCPRDGVVILYAGARWVSGTGDKLLRFLKNNTTAGFEGNALSEITGGALFHAIVSAPLVVSQNDYFEHWVFQSTGASIDIKATDGAFTFFAMRYVE